MYYAGIDISKRFFTVSILEEGGEIVKSPIYLPGQSERISQALNIHSLLKNPLEKHPV